MYSVNEEAGTVALTKEIPVIRSNITSNTIYDEKSGHILAMCGYIPKKTAVKKNDGYRGMTYEFDYESGQLLAQFAIKGTFYRGSEVSPDYDDMALPMDVEENYLKGTLKKPVSSEEKAKAPEETVSEENVSLMRMGSVLYVKAKDHSVSQVIFRGQDHTYVYDEASIIQYYEKYKDVTVGIAIPMQELEPDRYELDCVFQNELMTTGHFVTISE